jgi:hypothetical protein
MFGFCYLIYRLLTTGRQQIIFIVAVLQTAEMEYKLLLDLVHWTLSVHAFFSSLLHEIRTDSIQNASLRQ